MTYADPNTLPTVNIVIQRITNAFRSLDHRHQIIEDQLAPHLDPVQIISILVED